MDAQYLKDVEREVQKVFDLLPKKVTGVIVAPYKLPGVEFVHIGFYYPEGVWNGQLHDPGYRPEAVAQSVYNSLLRNAMKKRKAKHNGRRD